MRRSRSISNQRRNSTIDLHHLRCAVAADDCGSLRQAAELLLLRQSTLSRHIRQLEHLIGVAVFERSNSGVNPTAAGRDFLRTARTILEQVDALITTATSGGRGETGRLTLGFCTSISAGNLRATMIDFKQRFPQMELVTIEHSRVRLMNSLRTGIVDILIVMGDLAFLNCKALPLWNERILIALPEDHRLAKRDIIYWTDLRNETILLSQYDPGRELEDLLISKLVSPSDRPKIERHDVSRGSIKGLINMRIGVSLILESDTGLNFSGLAYRELRDGSGPSHVGFSAVWRADNVNPALTNFLKLLTERYSPRAPSG